MGLLETCVNVGNVASVQRGLLPRWNWFVDHTGPGNRIWLAWDNDLIGVDVLDIGNQFVHCDVFIRCIHVHVFITIVYGVNDVVGRRFLWDALGHISPTVCDVSWLVGGDFNTILDDSEGEWFSWHNCSRDSRSLWKRLDRLLRVWRHRIVGTSMFAITRKLKALKPIFRAQRQKKGDLSNNVKLGSTLSTGSIRTRQAVPLLLHLEFCSSHPGEIKNAVFDIDEVKAPGPDDYSSGFFKAAWPVVGEEVTRAIMEFFRTGRLLKQVNTTLISLIPKVATPTTVVEFRPISCCNVLYKIITKILVQRMRGVLDKLINPSQNAFVPGRSIGDNILLAQELFHGYNQQHLPPRCALKVDLRKVYDTVEWDFLTVVHTLFGFPAQFISWIGVCYNTVFLGLS
ncbi:UNVERIFIED_CONTAM: hypothetical protein Slati_0877000 [Sesamum latifolium]|uniref:Reverse transcriptase domain-containing protein n=1 Tax=Sesamum latifolium TaxID=2727402 RepID=A0AAW2XP75_9LAMI